MEHAEDRDVGAATAPVFVDDTGRRRTLTRRVARLLLIGFAGYLGLLAAGFARDPRIGPVALPTFGLPGLHPAPAPVVLGETTARTTEATGAGADPAVTAGADKESWAGPPSDSAAAALPSGGARSGRPGDFAPETGTGQAGVPAGGQAAAPTTTSSTTTTTSVPAHQGAGPRSTPTTTTTTTTTAPSSPMTSSTTTTTTPGQGSGPVSSIGPEGDGAPGLDRRATTTTTGPRR